MSLFFKKTSLSILGHTLNNNLAQNFLQNIVHFSHYFMGIGPGARVATSGEKVLFNVLENRLKPPYIIFDLGANKGQFLNLTVENLNPNDFTIHCFEPGKETYKLLSNRKPDTRVRLNNIGIGKNKEETILYYDTPGSGIASLTRRRLNHFGIKYDESEVIQIDTIDNYCEVNNIEIIHLLKMDIEGHELDALMGAKNMFANKAVDIVSFEFGGCNIDTRTFLQDFWYFFLDANMELFRLTPWGRLFRIENYKEIYEQFRTTNYVAIRMTE
ncbi:MAG: FkbM family methyltransferase [Anaerolineaceae bacterium]|nr:FkbM family methyltransferase [Anaerolineaceae bacterium]